MTTENELEATIKSKFKVGDKVVCLCPQTSVSQMTEVGQVYEISEVNAEWLNLVGFERGRVNGPLMHQNAFRLASSDETKEST